jgi:hypothetical protein
MARIGRIGLAGCPSMRAPATTVGNEAERAPLNYIYQHLHCAPMVIWLADLTGVDQKRLRPAVREAVPEPESYKDSPRAAARARRILPWKLVHLHLARAKQQRSSCCCKRLGDAVAHDDREGGAPSNHHILHSWPTRNAEHLGSFVEGIPPFHEDGSTFPKEVLPPLVTLPTIACPRLVHRDKGAQTLHTAASVAMLNDAADSHSCMTLFG